MGWKTRGKRSFYYQSEPEGGRVVSRYVGTGAAVSLISRFVDMERQKREIEAHDHRARQERAERFAERIARAFRTLMIAAESIIQASGYRRHHRGQWRRKRTMSVNIRPAPTETAALLALAERHRAGEKSVQHEAFAIPEAANKGEEAAARKVAYLARAEPDVMDALVRIGAETVEKCIVEQTAGKGKLGSDQVVYPRLDRMRRELAGPNPTAVERLLAKKIVLCWLEANRKDLEAHVAESLKETIRQAKYRSRQRDGAHRRCHAALKALAAVRKLPIVAVQVNIGANPASRPGS